MLDPKWYREHLDELALHMKNRGESADVTVLAELDQKRRKLETNTQSLQQQRNEVSKAVGQAKRNGENADELMASMQTVKADLEKHSEALEANKAEIKAILDLLPNIPHESVPVGSSEADNVLSTTWGEPPSFDFQPQDHADLGLKLGLDFESAANMSGARFSVLHGQLAKLHRALAQFMLDEHTNHNGYEEQYVPLLVEPQALYGSGQWPKLKEDMFHIEADRHLSLVPTAEVPLTNLVRDTIIDESTLPIKMVAHTPCFRSEAGSYGRDTKGMIRQHQFEKVELVVISHPDSSYQLLEEMTGHAEGILQKLGLAYRKQTLCTGDMGFCAAKTYDLEVWLPSQNTYREISSCSNTEDFQARRLLARFKGTKGKASYVHTLNGSGLAVGRTLVAILENYQQTDGSVRIPDVLQSYMGGVSVLHPKGS